jgi:O-antigen ligase
MNGSLPVAGSHLTIYAYVSNAFVAFKSFIGNPFFGRGLGSHPLSYDEFIYPNNANILWQNKYANYAGVNRLDANSLFLRLVSETGLLGIIIVFYFIFRFRLKHCDKSLGIISNATFVLFILQLIRQGHYFYNGLFFFVWVYYFAYKIERKTV